MKHILKFLLIVLFASCSNAKENKKQELIKLIEINQDSLQTYIREDARVFLSSEEPDRTFLLFPIKMKEHHFEKIIDSLKFEIIKLK